ncbi:uncharacterized protein LOC131682138 [Topomyia yanbarensis]|uniref:uncharacterized protein LOC131682138 n=1 Tax=Topomyia yanbarensis TaxID=2498891 RepID=UPI00273C7D2A|nr:uncharacterized protein LOC131682138 [Topomyia yanbarensis]
MNEYLWEFAQNLPSDNGFQIVLKTALATAAAQANLGKTNNKWMCRKCKTLWMHGYFHVDEIKATDKFDKVLSTYEVKTSLSKKQKTYMEYMQSRRNTTVKYTCHLCSYKTRATVINSSSSGQNQPKKESATTKGKTKTDKRKPSRDRKNSLPKHVSAQCAGKKKQASIFSSKNTNQLQALANMLKKGSTGMSSQDRLKLLLK